MKITKLLFHGQYEDAYLYSGCLLLLGEDRTLRVYNLRRLMAVLETIGGEQLVDMTGRAFVKMAGRWSNDADSSQEEGV